MSDTSIISTISSYSDENRKTKNPNHHTSFWTRHWFHIITIFLSSIIFIISTILVYVLYKEAQRDQERRRVQNNFKQKYGLANKALDMITKDGLVAKWLKANKGPIVTVFRELMTDMVETISEQ
jgi:hypothetical protein